MLLVLSRMHFCLMSTFASSSIRIEFGANPTMAAESGDLPQSVRWLTSAPCCAKAATSMKWSRLAAIMMARLYVS